MNYKSPWYRWPENKLHGTVPWFIVLRRLIFYPIILMGIFLLVIGAFLGFGLNEAKRILKEFT